MSSSVSDSECSSDSSFCSDLWYFEDEFQEKPTNARKQSSTADQDEVDEGAYQDEPIASREWVEKYNERQKANEELEQELIKRLTGEMPVEDW